MPVASHLTLVAHDSTSHAITSVYLLEAALERRCCPSLL